MTEQVIVKLQAVSTMGAAGRIERMRAALALGVAPLRERPQGDGWLSIVGYGPSLRDTWQAIDGPIMTCPGSHNFLLERGIVPNWHAEADPWPAKAMFTRETDQRVTYLIASCCDPQVWENVKGRNTRIWHCGEPQTEGWLTENDPFGLITGFGTTIGERCLQLAAVLGYTRVRFFGLDCSFTDEQRAGPHQGGRHEEITVEVPGFGEFRTSHAMLFSARTLVNALLKEGWECEFFGNGLARSLFTRAILRMERKRQGWTDLPVGNIQVAA